MDIIKYANYIEEDLTNKETAAENRYTVDALHSRSTPSDRKWLGGAAVRLYKFEEVEVDD